MSLISLSVDLPDPTPNRGSRRIVKMIPTPCGMGWAIWTSPYTIFDDQLKEQCRVCVVLVGKGPPKPEPILMTVPENAFHRFPEDSIEW